MTRERLRGYCDTGVQVSLMALFLVVPLAFYTYTHDVFEINKLTAFRFFLLLALGAYLTRLVWVRDLAWRPSSLVPALGLLAASALLSTLFTNNTLTSVFGVYEDYEGILTIAAYLLLWGLVHQHVRCLGQVRMLLITLVAAGVLATGYGVAQNFGWDFVLWNPNTYNANRLFGSLGNPNFLAAYGLMTLPVAGLLLLGARRKHGKGWLLAAVLVMLLAIFFTKSRGALYALAGEGAALALYLAYDRRRGGELWKSNRRWFLVLAVLAGLTLLLPNVRTSIQTTVTRTLATLQMHEIKLTPRLYIWRSALQMIRDHPILGAGLDTFQITFPKYRLPEYWQLEWNGTPEKAHNFFLQIGATTGLLGLAAWLWLIFGFFSLMGRSLPNLSPERRHLAAAIMIAQIGFLIQIQFNFTVVAYGSVFWLFLALGPALNREEELPALGAGGQERISPAGLPLRRWLGYLAACCLIFGALVFSLREWVADVFFKRGIIYLTSGYSQPALPELARAVSLNPNREIYWVKYGIAFEEAAKWGEDKLALLQKADLIHRQTIAMNPLNGYDYNNLGRVYKFWGDYVDPAKLREAEKACRAASELDPYNVYFALDLASVQLSLRNWNDAKAISERLVRLFPDFAIPYAYLGYIALVEGQSEAAYRWFTLSTQKDWRGDTTTRASTWSNLGIVRARRNELDEAMLAFGEALKIRPQYLEARLNLGLILEQKGKNAAAAAEYRQIVAQAPQMPQAEQLKKKIEQLEKKADR